MNKFQSEIDGPLVGGDPGKRLIGPLNGNELVFFSEIPQAYWPRDGEWLVVSISNIFGSEELSSLAPAISERVPEPYVGLNPEDANSLGKEDGEKLLLSINGISKSLPVRVITSLQPGIIALPIGLSGLEGIALPAWGKVLENRNG